MQDKIQNTNTDFRPVSDVVLKFYRTFDSRIKRSERWPFISFFDIQVYDLNIDWYC